MTEYGCAVTNKFGLPSDDDDEYDDPRELMQKVSLIAAKKKEEKVVKPAQPAKEAAPASAVTKTDGAGRGRGGRGRGRGGAGRPRDGDRVSNDQANRSGEDRRGGPRRGGERGAGRPAGRGRGGFNRENRDANNSGEEVKENTYEDGQDTRAPRRRGGFTLGGPTGGRGGRGGRGRQFDRQSGSDRAGVRAFEKKDGHGKGNWGDQKDELTGETENIAPEAENAEPEAPREKTAEELAWEAEQAVFAKQKTLKEFKAQQNADAPKFNTRKAGEGVNDTFGKLIPMKKEVIPDREEDEVVVIHKAPRKQVVDISITFRNDRPERERNDRADRPPRGGQRGGPSGGRGGRGGPRAGGNRGNANTPFSTSEDAFPALGAK
uniref:HABP4_PAI-RBP1 domain-containing protein n=1 Tax=Caenorhabditis japonica TaxID=281687 RepID=A0A8R1HL61_CAEJA